MTGIIKLVRKEPARFFGYGAAVLTALGQYLQLGGDFTFAALIKSFVPILVAEFTRPKVTPNDKVKEMHKNPRPVRDLVKESTKPRKQTVKKKTTAKQKGYTVIEVLGAIVIVIILAIVLLKLVRIL